MPSFNQSECFISAKQNYTMLNLLIAFEVYPWLGNFRILKSDDMFDCQSTSNIWWSLRQILLGNKQLEVNREPRALWGGGRERKGISTNQFVCCWRKLLCANPISEWVDKNTFFQTLLKLFNWNGYSEHFIVLIENNRWLDLTVDL